MNKRITSEQSTTDIYLYGFNLLIRLFNATVAYIFYPSRPKFYKICLNAWINVLLFLKNPEIILWFDLKKSAKFLSLEEPTISSKHRVTMKHVIFCMLFSIFIFVRHNFMSKSIHLLYDHYFSKKDIDLNLMVCMYWDQKLNKTFTFAHFLKHLVNWHSWRNAMCNIRFKPVLP